MLTEDYVKNASKYLIHKWNLLPEKKFPQESYLKEAKTDMLAERVYKIITNLISITALYYILKQPQSTFLDRRLGGISESPRYFEDFSC